MGAFFSADSGIWTPPWVHVAGPEGGGSLGYSVRGRRAQDRADDRADYLLSSTFSPGGPTRPQTVSVAACEKRLAALDEDLRQRGFSGVATHPEGCGKKSRGALVTVAHP